MRKLVVLLVAFGCIGCARPVYTQSLAMKGGNARLTYWTAEGGILIQSGSKFCVAPPAQAARQIASQAAARANFEGVEASLEHNVNHETQELYRQTRSLLFFQFAAYRLCEMYLNDAISEAEYRTQYLEVVKLGQALVEAEIAEAKAEAARERAQAERYRLLVGD